jgi:hypothetical protein
VSTSKLNSWIQNLTSAAVFIGLVLVALEIRENNAIAEDEALSEFWTT